MKLKWIMLMLSAMIIVVIPLRTILLVNFIDYSTGYYENEGAFGTLFFICMIAGLIAAFFSCCFCSEFAKIRTEIKRRDEESKKITDEIKELKKQKGESAEKIKSLESETDKMYTAPFKLPHLLDAPQLPAGFVGMMSGLLIIYCQIMGIVNAIGADDQGIFSIIFAILGFVAGLAMLLTGYHLVKGKKYSLVMSYTSFIGTLWGLGRILEVFWTQKAVVNISENILTLGNAIALALFIFYHFAYMCGIDNLRYTRKFTIFAVIGAFLVLVTNISRIIAIINDAGSPALNAERTFSDAVLGIYMLMLVAVITALFKEYDYDQPEIAETNVKISEIPEISADILKDIETE